MGDQQETLSLPPSKEVFAFHPETKMFMGVVRAHKSPLEDDVYHIPAYATEATVPSYDENTHIAVWDETSGIWAVEEIPVYTPSPEEIILSEIRLLEARVTARRIREAVLGIDGGWLADREEEIAALRSQL